MLDLLDELRRRLRLDVLLVSHDLPVVESVADRIAVMCGGELVECAPAYRLSTDPRILNTRWLVQATPRLRLPEVTGS